ncbi:MAG: hypothetical protein HY694_00940 [Deltaproteobacteria bacterium]|nr:hypothetical protein [Deltaproteobacteria bacterium]
MKFHKITRQDWQTIIWITLALAAANVLMRHGGVSGFFRDLLTVLGS